MTRINGNIFQELQKKYGIDTLEGQDMILKELKKKMLESALEGELGYELGYKKGKRRVSSGLEENKNYRNGYGKKQVLTSEGPIEINVPRDRNGDFEPEILPKRSNNISDWEQRIINMYGLGLSNADIRTHFEEIYGVGVSEAKISYVTNKVFAKNRRLEE